MIEQSVSLASNGVVKVPGYEQLVRFGYTKNRGVYRLHVDATGEWEGLTVRAFWHVPGGNDRYPYYPQEENRYIDPYPIPRYPDVENGRRMPQIGFSQNGDWNKRSGQYERGGADGRSIKMPRQHLTHDEAEEWCDSMVNADGTKGCHWTLEQTQDVAKQRNITCDPNDFWAVMNMMYSDYCQVAKRQSVDTPGFYADMAKAFLEDADAADGKAYLYWDCIADK